MADRLRIGQLAERVGVGPKAVRYYEQLGLLPEPERSEAGYRLYGASDVERLRFIGAARRIGFSLGEIKEILALRDRGDAPCAYVREAVRRRLAEVDRQLIELRQLERELRELDAVARSLPPPTAASARYCHIIERREPTTRLP